MERVNHKLECQHCHRFGCTLMVEEFSDQDAADLQLGRLVRSLPMDSRVRRCDMYLHLGGEWDCTIDGIAQAKSYPSPDEAIRLALEHQALLIVDELEEDTTARDEYERLVREGLR